MNDDVPTGYLSPRLEGKSSPLGRGVFARARVNRGDVLAVWGGQVIRGTQLRDQTLSDRRLTLQIDEDFYIVSTREGPADWVNHSCEPNAGLRGQVVLVAMRDILPEEEVTFDYAMSDGSSYDEFECRCGTLSCRGQVTGEDWKSPELQRRYTGYFSPYIAARIEQEVTHFSPRTTRTLRRRRISS